MAPIWGTVVHKLRPNFADKRTNQLLSFCFKVRLMEMVEKGRKDRIRQKKTNNNNKQSTLHYIRELEAPWRSCVTCVCVILITENKILKSNYCITAYLSRGLRITKANESERNGIVWKCMWQWREHLSVAYFVLIIFEKRETYNWVTVLMQIYKLNDELIQIQNSSNDYRNRTFTNIQLQPALSAIKRSVTVHGWNSSDDEFEIIQKKDSNQSIRYGTRNKPEYFFFFQNVKII